MRCAGPLEDSGTAMPQPRRIAKKLFTSRLLSALLVFGLVASQLPMFSRLFILALLVLVDLSVDAEPMLNSDQNRRKEHEEALKTYRELAEKEPDTYLPEVAQTLNDLGIVDSAQN